MNSKMNQNILDKYLNIIMNLQIMGYWKWVIFLNRLN